MQTLTILKHYNNIRFPHIGDSWHGFSHLHNGQASGWFFLTSPTVNCERTLPIIRDSGQIFARISWSRLHINERDSADANLRRQIVHRDPIFRIAGYTWAHDVLLPPGGPEYAKLVADPVGSTWLPLLLYHKSYAFPVDKLIMPLFFFG